MMQPNWWHVHKIARQYSYRDTQAQTSIRDHAKFTFLTLFPVRVRVRVERCLEVSLSQEFNLFKVAKLRGWGLRRKNIKCPTPPPTQLVLIPSMDWNRVYKIMAAIFDFVCRVLELLHLQKWNKCASPDFTLISQRFIISIRGWMAEWVVLIERSRNCTGNVDLTSKK